MRRWSAEPVTKLVTEIIQGETMVAQTSRSFDLWLSKLADWAADARLDEEPLSDAY